MPTKQSVKWGRSWITRSNRQTLFVPEYVSSESTPQRTIDFDVYVDQQERAWVNTPGYRDKVRAGQALPTNPFSGTFRRGSPSHCSLTRTVVGASGFVVNTVAYGPYVFTGTYEPSHSLVSQSQLAGKLIEKAKGGDFLVPVFFAEASKTSKMVHDRAVHLVRMFNSARKGDFYGFIEAFHPSVTMSPSKARKGKKIFDKEFGTNAPQAVANAVLEHSYGWVPFMSEVRSAVNVLMDLSDRPDSFEQSVYASMSRTVVTETKDVVFFIENGGEVRGNIVTVDKHSRRATWRFVAKPQTVLGRIGLTNPAEIIWELVPLSFVWDWFYPLGDWFAALDAPTRFGHVGGTWGEKRETTRRQSARRISSDTRWKLSGSSTGVGTYERFARTAMSAIPSMQLLDIPFSNGLSPKRAADGIALLYQAWAGHSAQTYSRARI